MHVYNSIYVSVCRSVCRCVCVGPCVGVCAGPRVGVCVGVCAGPCVGVCGGVCNVGMDGRRQHRSWDKTFASRLPTSPVFCFTSVIIGSQRYSPHPEIYIYIYIRMWNLFILYHTINQTVSH